MFIEKINYDESHYKKIEDSLGIFFKNYICPVLLGLKTLFFCGACEKVLLDEYEIERGAEEEEQNSIQCDMCVCWYHFKCQKITMQEANNLKDEWLCTLCIGSLENSH